MEQTVELLEVPIDQIEPNRYQPREVFDEEGLEALTHSVRTLGVLHPPLVRLVDGRYQLISGERRWRAAKLAGWQTLTVCLRTSSDEGSAEGALVENIQRADLNPMEMARGLSRLHREFGYTQREIALRIGKRRSTVANYLRLLTLPQEIQEGVKKGRLSVAHAKLILSLKEVIPNQEGVAHLQLRLAKEIVSERLTVKEGEKALKKLIEPILQKAFQKRTGHRLDKGLEKGLEEANTSFSIGNHNVAFERGESPLDLHADRVAKRLEEVLGTPVKVEVDEKGRGRVVIETYSLEDLDHLLEVWAGDD